MFGIYFHQLNIPLLLVSSNLPLDDASGNGLNNFICAVEFIRQTPLKGVFVAYQNPDQPMHIHIGTRLSSCLPLSGDFISVQSRPFMRFVEGRFRQFHALESIEAGGVAWEARFGRILLIRPYPGLDYSHFNLAGVDAVLHDLYHSGTACATGAWGGQHSLPDFSVRCRDENIPLYLAPAIHSENTYSSTRELLAHGAKMIWNTSLESAYAKLALAYGNALETTGVQHLLNTNIAHEHIQRR